MQATSTGNYLFTDGRCPVTNKEPNQWFGASHRCVLPEKPEHHEHVDSNGKHWVDGGTPNR